MGCRQADAAEQAAWRSTGERLPCPQRHLLVLRSGAPGRRIAQPFKIGGLLRGFNGRTMLRRFRPARASIRLIGTPHAIQNRARGAMNRRHFGLSIAAATFLTRQLREAIAQHASRSSSSADTDSTRRMRDAAAAFLESLDEAGRNAVSFPLNADQRASWSNLPVAIVPRIGLSVGALGVESRRRLHDLLRASTSSHGYHKIAALMRHYDVLRADELQYLRHNPPRPRARAIENMGSANYWIAVIG